LWWSQDLKKKRCISWNAKTVDSPLTVAF
jgi:hypothetical protein